MIQSQIEFIYPISVYRTVTSHGWVYLDPWHWNVATGELSRLERLSTGELIRLKVSQNDTSRLLIQAYAAALEKSEHDRLQSLIKRWFSVEWDPTCAVATAQLIDPEIARFIKTGGGRFLRGSTFYEDFVKTVCTINTNWASTRRMVTSLVKLLGKGAFPTPVEVIQFGEKSLRNEIRLGFRARVISELTLSLLDNKVVDTQGVLIDFDLGFQDLIKLRGIGEYSAAHIMMLCHDFSRVPVDSGVIRYCKDRYGIDPAAIQTFFEAWGDYRFLGFRLRQIANQRVVGP